MSDVHPTDHETLPAGAQNAPRAGVIELTFGIPDFGLLPAEALRRACELTLAQGRTDALPYGANAGPPELRSLVADRISRHEDRDSIADEVAITGGNSQALDQVLTRFTRSGDTVLVELPTYMLAMGIVRDHPLALEGVLTDADGIDLDALEATLGRLQAAGKRARLLYTMPTYHNPTGRCLSPARRRRLVQIATAHDLLIVEDDVYRELGYDGPAPNSLWSIAPAGTVIRLGSFAKTIAPGLRVGWLTATPGQIAHFAHAGVIESGGGVSHFSASVVAAYLGEERYDEHLAELRIEYRLRRDALAAALTEHLPPGSSFTVPGGGFFIWVTLPEGLTATDLLPLALQRGVSFLPAARSMLDGGDSALRLAFSFYPPDQLAEGARRLGGALTALSTAG